MITIIVNREDWGRIVESLLMRAGAHAMHGAPSLALPFTTLASQLSGLLDADDPPPSRRQTLIALTCDKLESIGVRCGMCESCLDFLRQEKFAKDHKLP